MNPERIGSKMSDFEHIDKKNLRKEKVEFKKKTKNNLSEEERVAKKNVKNLKNKIQEMQQEEMWEDWENEIY